MRRNVLIGAITLVAVACAESGPSEGPERLNQMIPLIEQGLPVFGVSHPPYAAFQSRRGGDAEPTPQPDLMEVASEMVAYQVGDYELNNYSPATAEQYRGLMQAIVAAGGSAGTHPFLAKVPILHRDPGEATARLIDQLNEGQVVVAMQQVESAREAEQGIAAMRFTSHGGGRPESGFERAAAYWGMTEGEYLRRADVWPINPEGELLLTVIIESKEGVAKAREISAVPGVAIVTVGSGTLGGVFTSVNDAGERVRDQEGFDAAVATILAACKEYNKACGYPANNPDQVEELMADGWDFLIMQRRNQDAFDGVLAGHRISGRSADGN